MLTKNEIAFLLLLLLVVPFVIVGCASVTPQQWDSAQKACSSHGGFKEYVAKNIYSADAICNDGTILTKWPVASK